MRFLVVLFIFLLGHSFVFAQTTQPTPQEPQQTNRRPPGQTIANESQKINQAFDRLRELEIRANGNQGDRILINQKIESIYRKPGKEETAILSPSTEILKKYQNFLRQPNTGIFKLNGNSQCYSEPGVVNASSDCLSNKLPGAGTAYSFRSNTYRVRHLADIILHDNVLTTDGLMQQGMMVNLGDADIEQISADHSGLKYLFEFTPAQTKEELAKYDKQLLEGIKKGDFLYRLGFFATEKKTFALRSIAYKGKLLRSIDGVTYNEMDYDKRTDIIVVFRIVEKEANGDITIVWKELADKKSPKLDFANK